MVVSVSFAVDVNRERVGWSFLDLFGVCGKEALWDVGGRVGF